MKRLSLADSKILSILLILALCLCLCACRTTAGTDHDQIVRSAIDLAGSYIKLSRYEDALDVYNRALEQANDYRLYYNKAIVLSNLGRNMEAAQICGESFEQFPHIIKLKTAQAHYLRLAGATSDSYNAYQHVLELNPYDRDTRMLYIDYLIEDGQKQIAYEQALIMWDQGYRDEKTIGYLYTLQPNSWQNVYKLIVGEKSSTEQ